MDLISSIIGVLYCTFYEMLYRKSFYYREKKTEIKFLLVYINIVSEKFQELY